MQLTPLSFFLIAKTTSFFWARVQLPVQLEATNISYANTYIKNNIKSFQSL